MKIAANQTLKYKIKPQSIRYQQAREIVVSDWLTTITDLCCFHTGKGLIYIEDIYENICIYIEDIHTNRLIYIEDIIKRLIYIKDIHEHQMILNL